MHNFTVNLKCYFETTDHFKFQREHERIALVRFHCFVSIARRLVCVAACPLERISNYTCHSLSRGLPPQHYCCVRSDGFISYSVCSFYTEKPIMKMLEARMGDREAQEFVRKLKEIEKSMEEE